eukprot:3479401-Rhodomonas_salina.1
MSADNAPADPNMTKQHAVVIAEATLPVKYLCRDSLVGVLRKHMRSISMRFRPPPPAPPQPVFFRLPRSLPLPPSSPRTTLLSIQHFHVRQPGWELREDDGRIR